MLRKERQRAMSFKPLYYITFLAMLGLGARAHACDGADQQFHAIDGYVFVTSSIVRAQAGGRIYSTCVENRSDRDLWMDWFVPGPRSWIPAHVSLPSPRFFGKEKSVSLVGCLQYGNHSASMREPFIGHENDIPRIAVEQQVGCDAKLDKISTTAHDDFEPVQIDTQVYVPSDSKDPDATLMRLSASIGIEAIDQDAYRTVVNYHLEQLEGRGKGVPEELTLRTKSPELTLAMQKVGYGDRIHLSAKGAKLVLDVFRPKYFTIDSAQYLIFDRNDLFVGAIYIPVLREVTG